MAFSNHKSRAGGGTAFGKPTGGFGGFSTTASSASNLSYLADPPNLAALSDPQIAVSFKNLLKRDHITKTKALEELIAYAKAHPKDKDGGVEEAVLDAWVRVYPRMAIDDTRRVRELAHTLQLALLTSAQKRMERRLPKIVASWLAGTFDRDRTVSKAAKDSLASIFTTDEKIVQFWKKCQPHILEFATAAAKETVDSLSDERSTSKEDADAKLQRVLGDSLSLVLGLVDKLDAEDVKRNHDDFDRFLAVDAVMECANSADSFLRKTYYRLVDTFLTKDVELITSRLSRLSRTLLSATLKRNHAGSVLEFLHMLTKITISHPEIWDAKKPPLTRLRPFIEKGSHGSTADLAPTYWSHLDHLIAALPLHDAPLQDLNDFATSFRSGISNRDEPRGAAVAARTSYLSAAKRFIDMLPAEDKRLAFAESSVLPLLNHYIFTDSNKSNWDTGAHLAVLSRALLLLSRPAHPELLALLQKNWEEAGAEFVSRMSNSLPEVSSDFKASQQRLADQGMRWFALVAENREAMLKAQEAQGPSFFAPDYTDQPSVKVLNAAVDLLQRRNYKPFGAAATLSAALSKTSYLFNNGSGGQNLLTRLFLTTSNDQLQIMVQSPSAPYFFLMLDHCGDIPNSSETHKAAFSSLVDSVFASNLDDQKKNQILTHLLKSHSSAVLGRDIPALQSHLKTACVACAQGKVDAWGLFENAFANNVLAPDTSKSLVETLARLLDEPSVDHGPILRALTIVADKQGSLLTTENPMHMDLMAKLLAMLQIKDNTYARQVESLRTLLDEKSDGRSPLIQIIQENIDSAGPKSLDIETLLQQVSSLMSAGPITLEDLLPNTNIWRKELHPFLQGGLRPSLAITSSINGAYHLFPPREILGSDRSPRDRHGCSIPARMAVYTCKLINSGVSLSSLPGEFQAELLFLLALVSGLGSDQLAVASTGNVWESVYDAKTSDEVLSMVLATQRLLSELGAAPGNLFQSGSVTGHLITMLMQQTKETGPAAVYSARTLSSILASAVATRGYNADVTAWAEAQLTMRTSQSAALTTISVLSGCGEALSASDSVNKLCNNLVSQIAGEKPGSSSVLSTLVLFHACASVYKNAENQAVELPVAHNRLVFAVKQITSWFEDPHGISYAVAAEACRALQLLLPCIKDMYGSHWERSVEYCLHLWKIANEDSEDMRLPYLHSSVKLMALLEGMAEANDDLADALLLHGKAKSLGLISLLSLSRQGDQLPRQMVDSLVAFQISKIPLEHLSDLSDLYSLMASASKTVLESAFELLHHALPAAQEKISVENILEAADAQLPSELLSLLLDAPTLELYHDTLTTFPMPVRSYLLSWHLVFDAFSTASLKVRGDYANDLKAANYVDHLLDFTFDVLGHTAAHPLKLEKEGISNANITEFDVHIDSDLEEKNMHWLLVHLFYLTLKYTPGLFKTWYINCSSKQTKIHVEAWTRKYFSPLIVNEMLSDVEKWAANQEVDEDEDEQELIVKTSRTVREVHAGYEVDDFQASITIRIPENFPIDTMTVVGNNRVAVSERKWQSWITATQGIMTFSNGTVMDGLAAFKRNIIGAIKGHEECAICYSVISSDKRTPDKKCGTCHKMFHGQCLFKWFNTSHQNTCPLCRTKIDFLAAARRGRNDDVY